MFTARACRSWSRAPERSLGASGCEAEAGVQGLPTAPIPKRQDLRPVSTLWKRWLVKSTWNYCGWCCFNLKDAPESVIAAPSCKALQCVLIPEQKTIFPVSQ